MITHRTKLFFWGIYNVNLTLLPKFIILALGLGWYSWDALGMPLSLIPKKVLVLTTGYNTPVMMPVHQITPPLERIMNENPNNIQTPDITNA